MDLTSPRIDEAADLAVESNEVRGPRFVYASGAKPLDGYTIKRGIGRGGFGEVYFATSDAGKEVALKLIRRNLDVEMRGVTHCLNLKHPNLISVYDLRTDTMGDQWVVMEYVAGESLEAVIQRHPNGLPEEEALRWMRGIGAGVAYLHDHGIVHRDLKPGNVFLDTDAADEGMIKIGDYGLSKFISCSRRSGQTESVGTVHYMAPEIANGRYGREIDTYALGIMLYEMLTGHVPFEGESVGEVLMKHLTAEPNLDKLQEPYREIVKRTLAKDPETRIGTVQELLSLLPGAAPVAASPARALPPRVPPADGIGTHRPMGDPNVRGETKTSKGPPPPYHPEPIREPLFAAFTTAWSHTMDQCGNRTNRSWALLGIVVALVWTVGLWMRPAMMFGVVYLVYYFLWSLLIKPGERRHRETLAKQQRVAHPAALPVVAAPHHNPPVAAVEPTTPGRYYKGPRRQQRIDWQQRVRQELAAKPFSKLATELLGSMVVAGIVCGFLALLVDLVIGAGNSADTIPLTLWTWLVSTLGCWGILATAKFTEGRYEDQIPMRGAMLVIGAGVGCFAWWLSQTMMIGLPMSHEIGIGLHDSLISEALDRPFDPVSPAHAPGKAFPSAVLSVIYFAGLFVALRWWKMAEYARSARVSLMAVLLMVAGAWVIHLLAWYPQPTGITVAGIVAIATQVSSPWFPPSRRKSLTSEAAPGYGGYN